ncbi:MAG: hypothetical protein KA165_00930 [Saprospiraceae bacterium]|nr:hypothetical protein [Saprospiraceae bacterium]
MYQYILFWLPMPVLGVLNGLLRETVFKKHLGELQAHQASTIMLIALLFGYGLLAKRYLLLATPSDAFLCGFTWVALTLFFEFGFGYWFAKKTLNDLLRDYNLLLGRLWILVPLFLAILPAILRKL